MYRCPLIRRAIAWSAFKNENWLNQKYKYSLVEQALLSDYRISIDRARLKNNIVAVNKIINEHRMSGHTIPPTTIQIRDLQVHTHNYN